MKIGRLEIIWHKPKYSITNEIRINYEVMLHLFVIAIIIYPAIKLYNFINNRKRKCSNESKNRKINRS